MHARKRGRIMKMVIQKLSTLEEVGVLDTNKL